MNTRIKKLAITARHLIDGNPLNGHGKYFQEKDRKKLENILAEPPLSGRRAAIAAIEFKDDPELLKEINIAGPITDLDSIFEDDPIEIDISKYENTEAALAEYFVQNFGTIFRYDNAKKVWMFFNGVYWTPDTDGAIVRYALKSARKWTEKAEEISNNQRRKKALRWGLSAQNNGRLQSTIKILSTLPGIADSGNNWDTDPLLLGCPNGVYDLKNHVFRPGRQSDNITKVTGCDYIPGAKAPRWERFLIEVFVYHDLIKFVQEMSGYSATGLTIEQVIFILWGKGANGKSIFTNAISKALGDHAGSTPSSTIELSINTQTDDLAALLGKRIITVSEINESRRLNEARIKNMVSSDPITARHLYGRWFTYTPTFKIWMPTNHKPIITGNDDGIWRRIREIPFNVSFKGREDKNLADDLDKELPGILNWIIEGAREWLEHGLSMPEEVKNATDTYRVESDILSQFLEQCTIYRAGARTKAGELYAEYEKWCAENGERTLSGTAFGRKLKEREEIRSNRVGGFVYYMNLGILQR